ncbi:MAG: hypothetical protein ACUVQG_02745 [Thermogutta sp.]
MKAKVVNANFALVCRHSRFCPDPCRTDTHAARRKLAVADGNLRREPVEPMGDLFGRSPRIADSHLALTCEAPKNNPKTP